VPTLLFLEDVHWADEATLEMLRVLGRRLNGMPLLVLPTFREDEVSASHPLTVVLGDLATSPGVARSCRRSGDGRTSAARRGPVVARRRAAASQHPRQMVRLLNDGLSNAEVAKMPAAKPKERCKTQVG
jgi:hypothetical protein